VDYAGQSGYKSFTTIMCVIPEKRVYSLSPPLTRERRMHFENRIGMSTFL